MVNDHIDNDLPELQILSCLLTKLGTHCLWVYNFLVKPDLIVRMSYSGPFLHCTLSLARAGIILMFEGNTQERIFHLRIIPAKNCGNPFEDLQSMCIHYMLDDATLFIFHRPQSTLSFKSSVIG